MSPEHDHDKLTRLDVACVLDSGEQVDVEVQVAKEYVPPHAILLGPNIFDVFTSREDLSEFKASYHHQFGQFQLSTTRRPPCGVWHL